MLKRVKIFVSRSWPLMVLAFISLTPFIWFRDGLPIAGGDNYTMLNPLGVLEDFLHTWTERINFGYPNTQLYQLFPLMSFWVLLDKLGLTDVAIQRMWSVSLFLVNTFSIYFLFSYLFSRLTSRLSSSPAWGGLIAAVVYSFNPWVMTDVITPVARLSQALLPLLTLFWIKGLEIRRPWHYGLLLGISSLFLSSSFAHPASAVPAAIVFIVYLFFYLLRGGGFSYALRFIMIAFFFGLVFNLWWFLPYLISASDYFPSVITEAKSYNFLWSTNMFEALRFMGFWAFRIIDSKTNIPHVPYSPYYYEPLFIILGFLLVILAMLPQLFHPRDKNVSFLSLLGLLGVFLSKGASSPFGVIYRIAYECIPILALFREPYARFTLIQVFSFSLLIGLSSVCLLEFVRPVLERNVKFVRMFFLSLLPVSLLLIILLLTFPMVTGKVIQDVTWHGKKFEDLHIKVPQGWRDLGSWLRDNDPLSRVLIIPPQTYGNCLQWESGICTSGPVAPLMISNPLIIYPQGASYFGDGIIRNFYDLFQSGLMVNLSEVFNLLNVDYVLVQNDYLWSSARGKLTDSRSVFTQISHQMNLRLKKVFGGNLELYENVSRQDSDRFVIAGSYKTIAGRSDILPERLILGGNYGNGVFFLNNERKTPLFIDARRDIYQAKNLKFDFNIREGGSYFLFWGEKRFHDISLSSYKYYLDGGPFGLSQDFPSQGWFRSLGKINLEEGDHRFEIEPENNGNTASLREFFNAKPTRIDGSFWGTSEGWQVPSDEKITSAFIPFGGFTPGGRYQVAFWFKDEAGKVSHLGIKSLMCGEAKRGGDQDECLDEYQYLTPEKADDWRRYRVFFDVPYNAVSAAFFLQLDKPGDKILISSFSIERVMDSRLMLVREESVGKGELSVGRKVVYQRLSPAKYRFWLKDGQYPSDVIFLAGFNKNWKIYVVPDGFKLQGPWETFFLKPLPEEKHFSVNGYANAWTIDLSDLSWGSKPAEMIVEYAVEKLYLIGLTMLGVGLVFGLLYFIVPRRLIKWTLKK